MRYYEDIEVDKPQTGLGTYEVTEEEIIEMGSRWDPQPFHTDRDAAESSIFGGLVASSVHLFAIAVALGHTRKEPVAAVTALGFEKLQWHAPARPGDVLHLVSRVTSMRLSRSRPDCGIVESRSEVVNQNDELVFAYSSSALIRRRPTE